MRRVALIGANGQLGTDLARRFERDFVLVPLTHTDVELCDHDRARAVLTSLQPDVVINTAAFHKVERCEADVSRALAVNCHATRNLAIVCNDLGAQLVHFSTDYVFSGTESEPYPERATPSPVNVYGASKVLGEHFLRSLSERYLLIRTSGLFGLRGSSGKGGNFVETMLRLGKSEGAVSVVGDQVLSPTYTSDLAGMVRRLVDDGAEGLFHITNSGSCSWYEFATAIFRLTGDPVVVTETATAGMAAGVRRPQYSVLENRRLQEQGYNVLRPWQDALRSYLENRAKTLAPVA